MRAHAQRLPFRDGVFDAVTALNVLYHLDDPLPAVREACRVLRRGGALIAATISRSDSPELGVYWKRPPTSFDAEDAPQLIGEVFDVVTVHPWDAPLVTLPSPAAIRDYLHGRQAPPEAADTAARELPVPLPVTKRGMLIVAVTTNSDRPDRRTIRMRDAGHRSLRRGREPAIATRLSGRRAERRRCTSSMTP